LPINSACASPYSLKMLDARRFTDGIARPCSSEPSLVQRRGVFQCAALGTINGERSFNSRSRSICFVNLVGSSGSGISDACNLSPISRAMARLCVWSMSMRLGIKKPRPGKKAPAAKPQRLAPPQHSRLRARLAILNGTGDRRFWLSARALVLRTAGRWQRPLAIRDMRRISIGERRSHISNAWRAAFVPVISDRDAAFHSGEEPEVRLDASTTAVLTWEHSAVIAKVL
jgi:hypothetical protein